MIVVIPMYVKLYSIALTLYITFAMNVDWHRMNFSVGAINIADPILEYTQSLGETYGRPV